jgi:hypothetical protein
MPLSGAFLRFATFLRGGLLLMRTRSVGHACLEIEAKGVRLLTDPWWTAPSYTSQWYHWPTPQPGGVQERTLDYVYLSHGHEDHLHLDTLKTLRPGATALVPESLSGGMADFLREVGHFAEVIELQHGKTVTLKNGLKATCYINLTDSMLVLDSGDQVLVNGNDALHASPQVVIDFFCRMLKKNHPKIDQLLLGHGGASWYPNCVRLPGKDDREAAHQRELHFQENFLHVVNQLKPSVACAFAASFVLLEPHNRWINEVKFDMPAPDEVFANRGGNGTTRCHLLLPGDIIDGHEVIPSGHERPSRESFERACAGELRAECAKVENLPAIPMAKLHALFRQLSAQVKTNRAFLGGVEPFTVELRLRDSPECSLYVQVTAKEATAELREPSAGPIVLEMRSEILETALTQEYGIESIVIGYGAVATLQRAEQFAQVKQLLSLLSPRQGAWRAVVKTVRRQPLQALGGIWRQWVPLALYVGERLGLLSHANDPKTLQRPEASGSNTQKAA